MDKWIFYIVLGLAGVTGVLDAGSQARQIECAQQQLKKLASQPVSSKTSAALRKVYVLKKSEVITSFFSAIHKTGLYLQSSSIFPSKDVMLDVVLTGDFLQIRALLGELAKQCIPFVIKRASIEQYQKQVKLKLSINFFNLCILPSKNIDAIESLNDPFFTDMFGEKAAVLQDYSIKQLKLMGFLQYPKQKIAIIALPNGDVREFFTGDRLGREQARLIDIRQQKIILQLNGKEISVGALS